MARAHTLAEGRVRWTPAQEKELEELKLAGKPWPEIAAAVGHPIAACKTRLSDIKRARREAAIKNGTLHTIPFSQLPRGYTKSAAKMMREPHREQLPPNPRAIHTSHLISDAELRARIELLGITGGLCGDPAPGRSALDQRMAGMSDTSAGQRGVRAVPKPTLAAGVDR